jgi:hypothetical protein
MVEDGAMHAELKITVQNDGGVEVTTTRPERSESGGRIDPDLLLRETLTTFRDWLNQGRLTIESERELTLLGRLLHKLLLSGASERSKALLSEKLREARESHKRVCLQLAFKENQAALASLPWEFLYDPDSNSFFATNSELILTRFISASKSRQALIGDDLPLRMLIVVSKKGGRTVAAADVVTAIQEFAGKNPDRIRLDPPLVDATPIQLQDYLQEHPPHIIHFIGHGRYNKATRQGEIALSKADDSPDAKWVSQESFRSLFTNVNCLPKLLFLQLCEGAVVEGGELIASFEGLAPTLIEAHVQAVVAMQFPIKNVHAGKLSTTFYDELTKHKSVGEAVQAARRLVSTFDPVAGGTPVLYMYGYDGAISSAARLTSNGRGLGGADPTGSESSMRPASSQPQTSPAGVPAASASQTTVSSRPTDQQNAIPDAILATIRAAGDVKIAEFKAEFKVGFQYKDIPDDILALNKRLNYEIIPALRCQLVPEIRQLLADLCQAERGTKFGEVLDAMYDAAARIA